MNRVKVLPLLRLWRCRDIILWRLLRGFDIRTKEHILCAPLRLCVICLFAGTTRTFAVFLLLSGKKISDYAKFAKTMQRIYPLFINDFAETYIASLVCCSSGQRSPSIYSKSLYTFFSEVKGRLEKTKANSQGLVGLSDRPC